MGRKSAKKGVCKQQKVKATSNMTDGNCESKTPKVKLVCSNKRQSTNKSGKINTPRKVPRKCEVSKPTENQHPTKRTRTLSKSECPGKVNKAKSEQTMCNRSVKRPRSASECNAALEEPTRQSDPSVCTKMSKRLRSASLCDASTAAVPSQVAAASRVEASCSQNNKIKLPDSSTNLSKTKSSRSDDSGYNSVDSFLMSAIEAPVGELLSERLCAVEQTELSKALEDVLDTTKHFLPQSSRDCSCPKEKQVKPKKKKGDDKDKTKKASKNKSKAQQTKKKPKKEKANVNERSSEQKPQKKSKTEASVKSKLKQQKEKPKPKPKPNPKRKASSDNDDKSEVKNKTKRPKLHADNDSEVTTADAKIRDPKTEMKVHKVKRKYRKQDKLTAEEAPKIKLEATNEDHGHPYILQQLNQRFVRRSERSQGNNKEQTPIISQRLLRELRLLEDRTVGKHACALWSSEQRRRFQQEYPGATCATIDGLLRKHWEALEDSEKLRYYNRASTALSHRHGLHNRADGLDSLKENTHNLDCTLEVFNNLSGEGQIELIGRKLLHLQRMMPKAYFGKLMRHMVQRTSLGTSVPMPHRIGKELFGHGAESKEATSSTGPQHVLIWKELKDEEQKVKNWTRVNHQWQLGQHRRESTRALNDLVSGALRYADLEEPNSFCDQLTSLLDDLESSEGSDTSTNDSCNIVERCKCGHDIIQDIVEDLKSVESYMITISHSTQVVPKILNVDAERALLADAMMWVKLPMLSLEFVTAFVQNCSIATSYDGCCASSADKYVLTKTGQLPSLAEIYLWQNEISCLRDFAGLTSCCSLESPSCMLSGLVLFDADYQRRYNRSVTVH